MSVNKAIIIGRLGRDPEIRYSAEGTAMANLSVATTYSRTDRGTGQRTEETEWHRIVLFGRQAEVAGEYLRKGSQIYVEGRLRTRKWTDQSGQERYTTEIVAQQMQMLGSRDSSAPQQQSGGYAQQSQSTQRPAQQQGNETFSEAEDDIPF